ncbi:MAG: ATP-binding cassette domain-containing protein [Candidatus Eisenbacteria bacterium]|nr:ATP-binding cassette domain-containing protein [Candidatus Eisenbacteria bacterium]
MRRPTAGGPGDSVEGSRYGPSDGAGVLEAEGVADGGIEAQGLRKSFDGAVAVDVDRFYVAPRTTLALIGPSGCGKSTLLRLLIGLVDPDEGTIRIGPVPMQPATRRRLRLSIGYVIQEGGLFPHLTAGANVTLVARDIGWSRFRIEERVEELLDRTRLTRAHLSRYPAQLSGGQRQRVALMRALMLDPEVLLMDEPLASLDPMIRSELQEELRLAFERLRKTVLFVTHDMAEAAYVAEEIALMRGGRILQRGSLADLTRRPADPFVTDFLRAQRILPAAGAEPLAGGAHERDSAR